MLGITFASDLHNRLGALKRLNEIARKKPNDWLVVTGDLTHNGGAIEYLRIAAWLDTFRDYSDKLIVVPGNHDAGPLGILYRRECLARFDRTFGTRFLGWNSPSVRELPGRVVVIGLDSCRETWWPGDFARGRIGWWQQWQLSRLLDKYIMRVRIVILHHHPFDRHPSLALSDSEKLMNILAGRCEVLAFGHKHKRARCFEQEKKYRIPLILASGAGYKDPYAWRIKIFDSKNKTIVMPNLIEIGGD